MCNLSFKLKLTCSNGLLLLTYLCFLKLCSDNQLIDLFLKCINLEHRGR